MKIQPPVGKVEKHIGTFQKHTVVFSAIAKKMVQNIPVYVYCG